MGWWVDDRNSFNDCLTKLKAAPTRKARVGGRELSLALDTTPYKGHVVSSIYVMIRYLNLEWIRNLARVPAYARMYVHLCIKTGQSF